MSTISLQAVSGPPGTFRKHHIISQETTKKTLEALYEYYEELTDADSKDQKLDRRAQVGWAYKHALDLAKKWQDAWLVFSEENIFGKYEEDAFDKALSLCHSKDDLEKIAQEVFSWQLRSSNEAYSTKIYQRLRELEDLKENNKETP